LLPDSTQDSGSVKTAWLKACKKAQITDLRFHDLRHTFGTRTTDAGTPLTATASVMGHASTRTTERYAYATDEGKRRAVLTIEKPRYGRENGVSIKACK
jgi:integrase